MALRKTTLRWESLVFALLFVLILVMISMT